MHRVMLLFLFASFFAVVAAADDYSLGPDSQRHPGVPQGKITRYTWDRSKVFPGTTRSYWIYVPAQYDGSKPACVMIFQDGGGFTSDTGQWRAGIVLDNLIQQGAMPVTIGIFIDPGVIPAESPEQQNRYNRSYEYDSLGDRYARFLIDEILPEVGRQYKLSSDPNDRGLAGSSSGGIAAFTAAWERPDQFRRVLSFVGSFTDLKGGDRYVNLVRKMEPKPLRVFQQDGSNDQTLYGGSWFQANSALAASLEYAGYDSKFVVGTEGHNARHGAAILPDALRWLWREYPKPVTASAGLKVDRHFITQILDPGKGWELVGEGYQFTEGPAVDKHGNVYFCDAGASRIYKAAVDGKVTLFKEDTGGATGLMFDASGRLYAAESARKRVVAYEPDGRVTVLGTGFRAPNDLAVSSKGTVYFSDLPAEQIWMIDPAGAKKMVFQGEKDGNLLMPNGVRLSPDHALLIVADTLGRSGWSFHIAADGSLSAGQPFYRLDVPDEETQGPLRSGADGLTVDDQGFAYFATGMGIQICDQPGRVIGIMAKPGAKDVSNLVFGGSNLEWLYATSGDKVYRRHLRRKGVFPWTPVKLPRPQL
ncbi:MAG: SMP-30/gluconolactonase/LRE family protein [Candidatus Sulfopaludibacter sp.]|nr:SMP-30/gluconolactonase/LRE family protein [Candidatus Sulfopaludibacter sp.]